MAPGSQPASMPAESNRCQQTHLISPDRSELSEIDPSWEIRALADADGSIGTSSAHGFDAAMCANPHTPVCGSQSELSPVPTVEQCADAVAAAKRQRERAKKIKQRAKAREAKQLAVIAVAAGDAGREMREARAERDASAYSASSSRTLGALTMPCWLAACIRPASPLA